MSITTQSDDEQQNNSRKEVNFLTAIEFLMVMGCEQELLHFRTLDDSKSGNKNLNRNFHGKFSDLKDQLKNQNENGAGVYVTINLDDESGSARKDNIIGIRSFFADKDNGNFDSFPLSPTIIIKTKNGSHAYWVLKNPNKNIDQFTKIQKKIASHLGSDAAVSDLPRIMRLPGFNHNKDLKNPFMIEIIEVNEDCVYSLEEVNEAFEQKEKFSDNKQNLKFLGKETKRFMSGDFDHSKPWNPLLFKSAKDFQQHELSKEFFIKQLEIVAPLGYLDHIDLATIDSAYSTPPNYPPRFDESKKSKDDFEIVDNLLRGKFVVYLDEVNDGIAYFRYISTDKTYEKVGEKYLQSIVVKHFKDNKLRITTHKAESLIKLWSLGVGHLPSIPKAIAVNDDNERAFTRVRINPSDTATPYWDYVIGKIETNADAFQAYIWSIFETESKNQQYLWLYGEGGDGKGSVLRLINYIIGDQAFVGLSAKDEYWTASCVGKRVAVFNDLTKSCIALSSEFKQLTGGDKVPIRNKYEKAYSAYLDTKIIITTNKNLMISSEESDLRRCIFVKFKKDQQKLEKFEENLRKEANGILLKCRESYYKLLSDSNHITCDIEAAKEGAKDFEIEYETIFHKNFVVEDGQEITLHQFYEIINTKYGLNNFQYSEIKSWVIRTQKTESGEAVREVRRRQKGPQAYYLTNIRLRSYHDTF